MPVVHNILLISAFGIAGILSRYGIDQLFADANQNFPISTFLINIVGSFLAGTIYAFSLRELPVGLQTALLVGFCGGFTTFSAYALQTFTMFEKGKLLPALAYFIASPMLGLFAAFIPVLIAKKWLA